MSDGCEATPNERFLLERLRLQANHVEALQRKISQLERERNEYQDSRRQHVLELQHHRELKAEWVWFFDNSPDMLCVMAPDGQIRRANAAFARALGYSVDELLSHSIDYFFHPDDMKIVRAGLRQLVAGGSLILTGIRTQHKDGSWRWISWTCPALASAGRNLYAIGRDITDSKLTEAELLFRAQHDPMTMLANRSMFDQILAQALARSERNPANEVGLLVIDLDGFKSVNDRHGHAAGDEVLKITAARLTAFQRKQDMVCRIGGDEFAWIVEGPSPLNLEPLAQRIVDAVSQPIVLDAASVRIGCSIGIAVHSAGATDAGGLYQQADAAMYAAKKGGKNGYANYRETVGSDGTGPIDLNDES